MDILIANTANSTYFRSCMFFQLLFSFLWVTSDFDVEVIVDPIFASTLILYFENIQYIVLLFFEFFWRTHVLLVGPLNPVLDYWWRLPWVPSIPWWLFWHSHWQICMGMARMPAPTPIPVTVQNLHCNAISEKMDRLMDWQLFLGWWLPVWETLDPQHVCFQHSLIISFTNND